MTNAELCLEIVGGLALLSISLTLARIAARSGWKEIRSLLEFKNRTDFKEAMRLLQQHDPERYKTFCNRNGWNEKTEL